MLSRERRSSNLITVAQLELKLWEDGVTEENNSEG